MYICIYIYIYTYKYTYIYTILPVRGRGAPVRGLVLRGVEPEDLCVQTITTISLSL